MQFCSKGLFQQAYKKLSQFNIGRLLKGATCAIQSGESGIIFVLREVSLIEKWVFLLQ